MAKKCEYTRHKWRIGKAWNYITNSGGKDAIPLGWHMRATKVRNK